MKRILAITLAIVTLCSIPSIVSAADTGTAPRAAGGQLTSGVSTTGRIDGDSDERWTINVPSGSRTLTIRLDGNGEQLDLLGRAGAEPSWFLHDIKTDTADGVAVVTVDAPAAGPWYLTVSGRFLFEPHSYVITATVSDGPVPTTTATSTTSPTTTAPTTTSTTPTTPPDRSVVVDRDCADGTFVQTVEDFRVPSQFTDISDLVNGYSAAGYMNFINGVLSRRYPTGKRIVDLGGGQAAVDRWLWRKDTAAQVLGQLSMVVHEIGHQIDKSNPENKYFVTRTRNGADLVLTAPGMHGKGTTSTSPMFSMARSLLLADAENRKRPPAERGTITTSREFGSGSHGSDRTYAETYLNGDPSDTRFDSGDQGFNMLVEEWNQYINSMAVTYYLRGDTSTRTSDRHALLTFLWWIERYLAKIRTEHPDQHTYLTSNPSWRTTLLTLWGRSWRYLNTSVPGMEPDTAYLTELVRQPHLLTEIQRLRGANGCGTPTELFP
ncbi:hypothetical protein GCM10010492_70010 [Saccharothrix mutabilis subsp. mutabilis]|uniref:Peptidase C-terminal archaeal/bacterial domain-containing protein n=2 Tax=Saccharothrix mutabilis TaxID=33921 RepID=A0ABP3EEY9_9PSEU